MQAKDEAAPHKTSTSISVRCFTLPTAAPLMVVSARERQEEEHLSELLYLPCCTSYGREREGDRGIYLSWSRERQEEEVWKRSVVIVAAALEEGESPGRRDGESTQEMCRANQGYQSALSTPWLPK